MRVKDIAVLFEFVRDSIAHLLFVRPFRPKGFLHLGEFEIAYRISSRFRKAFHSAGGEFVVAPREFEHEPLEVGTDEYIHRRTGRLIKLAFRRVLAAPDKVGKHVVAIAGANKSAYRQAHSLGVITG